MIHEQRSYVDPTGGRSTDNDDRLATGIQVVSIIGAGGGGNLFEQGACVIRRFDAIRAAVDHSPALTIGAVVKGCRLGRGADAAWIVVARPSDAGAISRNRITVGIISV